MSTAAKSLPVPPALERLAWWERLTLGTARRFLRAVRPPPRHFADGLWADTRDLKAVGLIRSARAGADGWPAPSLTLGAWHDGLPSGPLDPIRCHGERHPHALILSPTGGGKTWTAFLPTLIGSWQHSTVCFDLKNELYRYTSGFRASFSHVLRFAPAELGSARYNPLDQVRPPPFAVGDVRNIVAHLAPDEPGHGQRDRFFDEMARPYLSAAILYVLDAAPPAERCLAGVASALARGPAFGEALKACGHPDPATQAFIREAAARIWNNPSERMVGSILGTADSYLAPFLEPVLGDNTRCSDFQPSDLMCGAWPVSLYLCSRKPDLERSKPLLRVLIAQLMAELQAHEDTDRDGRVKRWRLLWGLDELPALGRLADLGASLPVMRSFGQRLLAGAQGAGQLRAVYGSTTETIVNNCRLIATRQNSLAEAKELSGLIGEVVEVKRAVSRSFGGGQGVLGARSESESEAWRVALQPAEIVRLPGERLLVLGEDRPILGWRSDPGWWRPWVIPPAASERLAA